MFFLLDKDVFDKINDYAEDGKLGKLERLALNNSDYRVRRAAYRGIGRIRADASTEFIFETLEKKLESEPKVLIAVAESLGRLANRNDFEKIQHIAADYDDPEVYKAMMDAATEAKGRSPRNLVVK